MSKLIICCLNCSLLFVYVVHLLHYVTLTTKLPESKCSPNRDCGVSRCANTCKYLAISRNSATIQSTRQFGFPFVATILDICLSGHPASVSLTQKPFYDQAPGPQPGSNNCLQILSFTNKLPFLLSAVFTPHKRNSSCQLFCLGLGQTSFMHIKKSNVEL